VAAPSATAQGGGTQLTLLSTEGVPLANATVAVFLHPFEHPHTFTPTRLLMTTADSNGEVNLNLELSAPALNQARESVGGWINVEVRALDPARNYLITEPMSLQVSTPSSTTLTAAVDLTDNPLPQDLTNEQIFTPTTVTGCSDADPDVPMCQKLIGQKRKPVKVASLHASRAISVAFVFKQARETRHEIITRICNPRACGDWSVGESRVENKARGSSASLRGSKGPWHRVMRPVYEERKYKYCATGQSFRDCEQKAEYWEPHVWTGAINRRFRPDVPDYVRYDRFYSKPLARGEVFTTHTQSNQTYETGLKLLAIELKSKTGYSQSTAIRWKGLRGCKSRRLYGHEKQPTEAGVIYARSRRCR
jgi:hypothetical protein